MEKGNFGMIAEKIKIIGFDADDTLWVNEPYYREAEESFIQLIASYGVDQPNLCGTRPL